MSTNTKMKYWFWDLKIYFRDKKQEVKKHLASLEDDFYLRAFCCFFALLFLIACFSLKTHHDEVKKHQNFYKEKTTSSSI